MWGVYGRSYGGRRNQAIYYFKKESLKKEPQHSHVNVR